MALVGYKGSVSGIGAEVVEWAVELSADALDVTTMEANSSGWRQFLAGLKQGTVRMTCLGTTLPDVGSEVSNVQLKAQNANGSESVTISGNVLVTGVSVRNAVEGRTEFEVTGQFSGDVTVSTA